MLPPEFLVARRNNQLLPNRQSIGIGYIIRLYDAGDGDVILSGDYAERFASLNNMSSCGSRRARAAFDRHTAYRGRASRR